MQNPDLAKFKSKSAWNALHSDSKSDFFSKTYQKVILSKKIFTKDIMNFYTCPEARISNIQV